MTIISHNSITALQKCKRRLLQHVWVSRILLAVGFIIFFLGIGVIFARPVKYLVDRVLIGPRMVSTFFSDPLYTLPSYGGRTNILFVGMGGGSHDGALLTDTMIFISMDLKHTEVNMLSIPRDIWVPSLSAKINAAYMLGEEKSPGGGYPVMEDAVYEIVGQPIHYVVSLDFYGFVHLIDLLGGVDITVDREFTDTQYPIAGKEIDECNGDPLYRCRYETITFKPGLQHMDGATALKFSRSRHAQGDEGTDFARSVRQQKVIQAIKDSLISSQVLLNPKKLMDLKNLGSKYVKLDREMTDQEYAAFAGFGVSFWRQGKEIEVMTLDTGSEDNPGFLVNPSIEKYDQWVLEPRAGTWAEFQAYFRQQLTSY